MSPPTPTFFPLIVTCLALYPGAFSFLPITSVSLSPSLLDLLSIGSLSSFKVKVSYKIFNGSAKWFDVKQKWLDEAFLGPDEGLLGG